MLDNKTLKAQSALEMLFPCLKCDYVCVCVCVCVCVRTCAERSKTDKQITLWASCTSKRSNTHKACKNSRLGEYSLKQSLCLKVNENSLEKIRCVSIYCLKVTDCASSMLIKEQNAKRKSLAALNLYNVIALISINLSIHTVKTMQCSFTFDYF